MTESRPLHCSRAVLVLAAVVALLVFGRPAAAQEVRGRVLDDVTDQPIAGAIVTMFAIGNERIGGAITDSLGFFVISARYQGRYLLRVESFGYMLNVSPPVELGRAETVDVEFRLKAGGILLAPLSVVARRNTEPGRDGFERRLAAGSGILLDPMQVAELRPQHTSDVFRNVEGLLVVPDPANFGEMLIRSMRGAQCLAVFIDHSPYPVQISRAPGGQTALAAARMNTGQTSGTGVVGASSATLAGGMYLDQLDASRLRGIEIYRTFNEIPKELRAARNADAFMQQDVLGLCGMIIVWTTVGW